MPDDIWWPDDLARRESEHSAAIAQDEGRAPISPMPHEIGSDNIDDVRAAISKAEDRCCAAEIAFEAANTIDADWTTLNAAEAEYEAAVAVLVTLENRLEKLEDRAARAEERSLRGWAQWATR